MTPIEILAPDLILIDTEYNRTRQAIGCYLLLGGHPALIETGPTSTIEALLHGIGETGLDPAQLQAVAVTHIHLDHAGAAGALVRQFPHLHVYVHPVGAPHLIDPSRLLASARRLYGNALETLFGEVVPVPEDRVRAIDDGAQVVLGSRRLVALDTPGHARHHHAYLDERSGDLFTGDIAGVALPGTRYVRPPSPPPEFDLTAWLASLARVRALRPTRLLLTHFGPHTWIEELFTALETHLRSAVDMVRDALASGLNEREIVERLRADVLAQITEQQGKQAAIRYDTIMPLDLTALGLIRYIRKEHSSAKPLG